MVKDFFDEYKVDEFEPYKLNNNLSGFDVDESMLLFFGSDNSIQLNQYVTREYSQLVSSISEVDKKFINLSKVEYPENLDELLKFYIPHLLSQQIKKIDFDSLLILDSMGEFLEKKEGSGVDSFAKERKTLNYLGYKGTIKSGFILLDNEKIYVIECNDLHFTKLSLNPFDKLIEYYKFKQKELSNGREYDSRVRVKEVNPYENIDEDTLAKITQINNQLNELKDSGQLIVALPILKEMFNRTINKIDLSLVSTVKVDENHRIILPYFNDLEVGLSHLTKVVYILFYNNPRGIDIKELHLYEAELRRLYLNVSNQLDYDKMVQSINDLVSPSSKAIYTHISRIKSAFYKVMDKFYADNYIIVGEGFGSSTKYIPILKPVENFKELGPSDF